MMEYPARRLAELGIDGYTLDQQLRIKGGHTSTARSEARIKFKLMHQIKPGSDDEHARELKKDKVIFTNAHVSKVQ